ncbi:MAG: transcriptional repressor [Chloroflexi bacterium]|nr:transcriptional repressor [Chloroflexota bacterium]
MSAATVSPRLRPPAGDRAAILDALRTAGYRLTAPRQALVDLLVGQGGQCFTAEDIYGQVRGVTPRLGRATVYRTIERLVELSLLERIHADGPCHSYVLGGASHHHHLICSVCGRVWEFPECALPQLLLDLSAQVGFSVEGHHVEVFGRCAACRSAA